MEPILPAIDRGILKAELNASKLIRHTNYGNHEVYFITHHDSPNLMLEIGRLRELSFRSAGGGTGLEVDIDDYDTADNPYKQLIVWDPEDEEILGGYRFHYGSDLPRTDAGEIQIATKGLFCFSEEFEKDYIPYTIELGRSFVQPKYQSKAAGRKALFALDNLWDGLGAMHIEYPESKYFFGKVTMYPEFNREARDMILCFMKTHFDDKDNLVFPKEDLLLSYETDVAKFKEVMTGDYKKDYKVLSRKVRDLGHNIPPLINTYMNLSPTMKVFGTALNNHFGAVEETGILITIDDIFDSKKERHMQSYLDEIAKRE